MTRHGKPAGVLIGFESEDDWFDYRLEHHPEFLQRVAKARVAPATTITRGRSSRDYAARSINAASLAR